MPPTRDTDVCFLPAGDLVRCFRARRLSPTEVVQAVLARIDAVNPALNALVTVDREGALAAARRATAALARGRSLITAVAAAIAWLDGARRRAVDVRGESHLPLR